MDSKRLAELILDMAQHPHTAPHLDLLGHSDKMGWLAVRHANAANNMQGRTLTKHAEFQLMNEIQVSIFRGYIVDLLAPELADLPPDPPTR